MQYERIAVSAAPSASVRGLGVCDALRVELQPVQLPWVIDELDELRGPLEESLQRAHTREEVNLREYELRLLRMMRTQLPPGDGDTPIVLVGPSGLVGEIIRGTLRNVVDALSDLVDDHPSGPHARARLRETAAAAAASVETFLDCRDVEAFNFDADADAIAPW